MEVLKFITYRHKVSDEREVELSEEFYICNMYECDHSDPKFLKDYLNNYTKNLKEELSPLEHNHFYLVNIIFDGKKANPTINKIHYPVGIE